MKKILIIGSNGNLAKSILKEINSSKFNIFKISRKEIDFDTKKSSSKLNKYLKKNNPDSIINCIGLFKGNNFDFTSIFNINTKVAWDLINFYRLENKKKVKIILIGSSAYNKPRKNYILYAASKSALNSIVKSAKDLFINDNIKVYILNPPAMKSKMRDKFFKNNEKIKRMSDKEIDPSVIAKKIAKIIYK